MASLRKVLEDAEGQPVMVRTGTATKSLAGVVDHVGEDYVLVVRKGSTDAVYVALVAIARVTFPKVQP